MSEYQYYEFVALDQPLNTKAQAEVRALSTRARITATSFVNEYEWGDFRGDPSRLVERHYDAHLYLANWGTRRLLLRLPRGLLDLDAVEPYLVDEQIEAWTTDTHLVLDLHNHDETGDWDYEPQGALSAIVGVRNELAAGDHRALYLAWLAGYGTWERDEEAFDRDTDDEPEPPVPAGLRALTAAQRALADFLRLDDDLLAVAAEASPPLDGTTDVPDQLAAWLTALPGTEKDRLLQRVVQDQAATVRMELLRRFHDRTTPLATPPRRTVSDLLDETARRRAGRQQREQAERTEEEARRERDRTLARERRLDGLAQDRQVAWTRVDALIATRKPADYDAAIALLVDLRALADREERPDEFARRHAALRLAHKNKPSLIARLARVNL
ncbi:hypothetical protein [Umezawaea sp. Da 62-37]|uniref:hypothetical protein n=1 Tax=Umezawaea sp. Da 62-37 TaxID=3075927 RepID=UPI0028F73882|nr:hypothetical protein [Umezawaea sp. Da 62-37]WNV82627.1 hypothetical protein RM788_31065 [Umezawaea sp. Da 62-37]